MTSARDWCTLLITFLIKRRLTMYRPIIARRLNKQFHRPDTLQLSNDLVEYADSVIRGLHTALIAQSEPVYRKPEHPINGWGLTDTPLTFENTLYGIPIVGILGRRAIYLSEKPHNIQRVLYVPHPRIVLAEQVVQVRQTTVPKLLAEDPTLYYALLNNADASITEFNLNYRIPELPLSPDN